MAVIPPWNLTVLFILSISFICTSIHAKSIKYCDKKADYPVKVKGIKISPDPVATGKPATFSISASSDKAISGGMVVIDVSYFGLHVHSESHDLCEETSCPISAGEFILSHTQTLPTFTPPGLYTLKMKMEDGNENSLTCIRFNFKIGFGSSVAAELLSLDAR